MSRVIPEHLQPISDLVAKIAPEKHDAVMTILLSPPPPKAHQGRCQACQAAIWRLRPGQRFCLRKSCQNRRAADRQTRYRLQKKKPV